MQIYSLIDQLFLKPISEGYGDRIVIIDNEQSYTYHMLFHRIQRCANSDFLKAFKTGDSIACVLPDSIEAVVVFFACIYRGLVPCLLNTQHVKHADCAGLITAEDQLITPSCSAEENVAHIVHEIAFCLYTSGTTGNPSLVLHRHRDPILMNEQYGRQVLQLCEKDSILATSRFYFAYGLNSLFFALLNKATLIIPPETLTPSSIWEKLSTYQPTVFFSVPTFYKRLLQVKPDHLALHSLRVCVSAGENLPLAIFNTWQQHTGISIIDGIGTTEVLSTFISNRLENIKPGSTGYAVPGFITELRHLETHQPVKVNEVGVLWVKGDTYVPYYPNNKAETDNRFVDGWFKTNDLFSLDPEGFYFYHGRSSELIKVSGIWVYPYKIEHVLATHPAVSEVIISSIQDIDGLTRIVGYVVLNDFKKSKLAQRCMR